MNIPNFKQQKPSEIILGSFIGCCAPIVITVLVSYLTGESISLFERKLAMYISTIFMVIVVFSLIWVLIGVLINNNRKRKNNI